MVTGQATIRFINICVSMHPYLDKNFSFNFDEKVYKSYKKYCEENHIILSRKIEDYMKKELEASR
jgi:hypothetical protein